jgi:hypothetical protein
MPGGNKSSTLHQVDNHQLKLCVPPLPSTKAARRMISVAAMLFIILPQSSRQT